MSYDSFGSRLFAKRKSDTDYTHFPCVIEGQALAIDKEVEMIKCLGQADRFIRKRGMFIDGGELPVKLEYTADKHVTLRQWVEDPLAWDVRIEIVDTENSTDLAPKVVRFQFDGVLKTLGLPLQAEGGRLVSDLAIAVSGRPVETQDVAPTPITP